MAVDVFGLKLILFFYKKLFYEKSADGMEVKKLSTQSNIH